MPDLSIDGLPPEIPPLVGTEPLAIVQGGQTRKATLTEVAAFVNSVYPSIYEATVNGSGGADYTSVVAALTAGAKRILVTGSTTEPSNYSFPAGNHTVIITLLPNVFVDCGDFEIYDATTNAALLYLIISGLGGTLNCGHTWSPTTEKTLVDMSGADSGSRFETSKCFYDTSGATSLKYHLFEGNANSLISSSDNAFQLSDTDADLIKCYNVRMYYPILLGPGTACASIVTGLGGVCNIENPLFINEFSPTIPVINSANLNISNARNFSSGNVLFSGENMFSSNFNQTIPGSGFSFNVSSNFDLTGINSPDGILYLQDGFQGAHINSSSFDSIDESACSTFSKIIISDSEFLGAPMDIGNNAAGVWGFSNVCFSDDVELSGENITVTGGCVGDPSVTKTMTINAGALNALVTGIRTGALVVNNEPTAQIGLNPLFA